MNTQTQIMNETQHLSNSMHFATLLDEQGHEMIITEEMIQRACADLAKRCHFPSIRQAA